MVNIRASVINKIPVLQNCQVRYGSAPISGTEPPKQFLCCYDNTTNQIQIIRSASCSDWYFERTVFPGQRLLFKALPNTQIEIHTGMTITTIIEDRISCDCLRISYDSC